MELLRSSANAPHVSCRSVILQFARDQLSEDRKIVVILASADLLQKAIVGWDKELKLRIIERAKTTSPQFFQEHLFTALHLPLYRERDHLPEGRSNTGEKLFEGSGLSGGIREIAIVADTTDLECKAARGRPPSEQKNRSWDATSRQPCN